jgi:pimeloyl-ACP methyl ester carboxylesterase
MSIDKQIGTFESFDGTPIYYEVRGHGKPLIFAYGIACSAHHWRHQLKYFSENYQTIFLDFRGHHGTPIPKDRSHLSIDAMAKDYKWLMDHLGLKSATFLGHSFGVPILIRAYDMYPEMFDNLVIINGFATNPLSANLGGEMGSSLFKLFKDGYQQLPQTLSYVWKFLATNPISLQLSAMAGGFNLSLTPWKDVEIYAKGVAAIDLDVFLTLFEQMLNYNGLNVVENISVPTLIMGGSKDTVTPLVFQETLHKKIKGSELTVVPYGSHCTQLDLPDFVNLKIEKFLKDHGY